MDYRVMELVKERINSLEREYKSREDSATSELKSPFSTGTLNASWRISEMLILKGKIDAYKDVIEILEMVI